MRFSVMLSMMIGVLFSALPARGASLGLPSSVIVVVLHAIDAARFNDDALVIKAVIDHLMSNPTPFDTPRIFLPEEEKVPLPKDAALIFADTTPPERPLAYVLLEGDRETFNNLPWKPIPRDLWQNVLERNRWWEPLSPQEDKWQYSGFRWNLALLQCLPIVVAAVPWEKDPPDKEAPAFWKRFPQARGYVRAWRPGYSREGHLALFQFLLGPALPEHIGAYLLTKSQGKWSIKEHYVLLAPH